MVRKNGWGLSRTLAVSLAMMPLIGFIRPARAQWTEWGGPDRNFKVQGQKLADSWPQEGPPELWSRKLGSGYSAVLVDDGRLYTMARNGTTESTFSLDAKSGEIVWEQGYHEVTHEKHIRQFGEGPLATPAIAGNRIFSVGVTGRLICRKKETGKEVWSHHLWDDFGGTFLGHGYSSSPFIYRDTVIVLNGGAGSSIIAFDQKDGAVVWKKHDFKNSYSVPRLISVDGEDQLLCFMAKGLFSVDPRDGSFLWSYDVENQWGHNISQPIFDDAENLVFLSTTYVGSRGLKLARDEGEWKVEEVWSTKKVQFYHVTSIDIGDYVYGSHGNGMGQISLFICINRKTGEIGWRGRGMGKSNTIHADDKFVLLDEDGKLALVKANPEKFEIISEVNVGGNPAWTVPTLASGVLYLRGSGKVTALDLRPQD